MPDLKTKLLNCTNILVFLFYFFSKIINPQIDYCLGETFLGKEPGIIVVSPG